MIYGTANGRHDFICFFFVEQPKSQINTNVANHRASYQKNSRVKYGNRCMSAQHTM